VSHHFDEKNGPLGVVWHFKLVNHKRLEDIGRKPDTGQLGKNKGLVGLGDESNPRLMDASWYVLFTQEG
jgi:hypothetical protein